MFSMFKRKVFAGIFVLAGFASACNEPDLIGIDLQPVSEQPSISTDTLEVDVYTVREDSLIMWGPLKNLIELPTLYLGNYNDPYAGNSFAGFVTQTRIGNTITANTFSGATTPDSVVLSVLYRDVVGDTLSTHHISIYELNEPLFADSTYYSTRTYARTGLLGHIDLVPKLRDSSTVGTLRVPPQLRIPLDTALGGRIMRQYISNPSTFASNTSFVDFFKGLVLTDSADGLGSILTFPSTSGYHRLTVYFSGNKFYEFIIDVNAVRVSYFKHEYSPATTDTIPDNQLVVASMAGLKDSLVIRDITSLYNNGPVSVSSARLVFDLEDGTTANYFEPHNSLLIFASDSLGKNVPTADALEPASFFGGTYNLTETNYTFNVARYLQRTVTQLVDGSGKDYGLFLVAGGSTSNARRTVLKGQGNVRLIVTTTKFNP